ncbi:MAG: hypothetical protein WBD47_14060 [Phormidesmis sp.]
MTDTTTTLRQHTLASIAAVAGTTKRTAQRWFTKCGDIGELTDNVRYFSDAERDQLLSHQSKRTEKAVPVKAEVVTGNHRSTSELSIDTETPVSLAKWRGNQDVQLATLSGDNLSAVERLALEVSEAMDADLSAQLESYSATQEQIKRAQAVKAALDRKSLKYEIETELLGKLQSQGSGDLQGLTEEIATLLRS